MTVAGPKPNRKCVFPFKYNGKTYTGCTAKGAKRDWCSTRTVRGHHQMGYWGYCASNCKKTTGPPPPAPRPTPKGPSGKCGTDGGADPNKPCIFPFKFRGVIHNACTKEGNKPGETKYWCSTKTNSNGCHIGGQGNWGWCATSCKTVRRPPSLPPSPPPPPKVHCQWSAWSIAGGSAGRCDKACGGGIRTLTRTIARKAQHGGNKCPGPSTKAERCNTQPCAGEES